MPQRRLSLCPSVHPPSHALVDSLVCLIRIIWLQVVPSQETTPQLFGPRRHRTLAFPAGQGSSLLGRDPTLAPPAAAEPWEAEPAQVGGLSRRLLMALFEEEEKPYVQVLCWWLQRRRP